MAQRDSTQDVIERTTASLFDPIRHLCTSVKQVGQIITDKIPLQDEVRTAKKKGELTTGQITAFRQLEKRIENDQNCLQATLQMLDGLEEAVGYMEEKAEAADYEATVFEETIPTIKSLLASKYQIVLRSTSSSAVTSGFTVDRPDAPAETSRPPAPREPLPVATKTQSPLQRLPSAIVRNPPIPVNSSERLASTRKANFPEFLPSASKVNRNGQVSGIPIPTSGIPAPSSGIPVLGYRQSPSASTNNLNSSYRSPNQAQMPLYRPVPQSANSNGYPSATPKQSAHRYPRMSAARSTSVLNQSAHNLSCSYRPPIYTPPPPQSEMEKINGLLARLEGKKKNY